MGCCLSQDKFSLPKKEPEIDQNKTKNRQPNIQVGNAQEKQISKQERKQYKKQQLKPETIQQKISRFEQQLKTTLQNEGQNEKAAKLYADLGILELVHNGSNEKAIRHWSSALKIAKTIEGDKSQSVAKLLTGIGNCHQNLKQFSKAEQQLSQALQIKIQKYGDKHESVADNYNQLGILFDEQEKNDLAKNNFEKGLQIYQEKRLKDKQNICLNNIAIIYFKERNNKQSLKLLEEVLKIEKEIHGEYHINFQTTLNNTANVHRSMGNYEQSLKNYKQSFAILKNLKKEKSFVFEHDKKFFEELLESIIENSKTKKQIILAIEIAEEILPQHELVKQLKGKNEKMD